jgi:glycosyltransferase involved in cell wall biosynthesis
MFLTVNGGNIVPIPRGRPSSTEGVSATVRYSVIITCYNQRAFIEDAINSVLSQRSPSKEVIVVDDGSRDGSIDVLRKYGQSVKLITLPTNQGSSEARNRGATVAKGQYLIFLDGDDLFTPWALDVYDRLIVRRCPSTILSGARWFEGAVPIIGRDDQPSQIHFIEYESLMSKDRGYGINIGAFVIDRSTFSTVGGWSREVFQLDGQELYAKLGYSGSAIVVCTPYTMLYRMHAGNSIRCVPPFLRSAHTMIDRERAGAYPGGRSRRFERHARHGGTIAFCVKKGFRHGLYKDAFWLMFRGWSMILAAIARRLLVLARGRRPIESCDLNLMESPVGATAVTRSER